MPIHCAVSILLNKSGISSLLLLLLLLGPENKKINAGVAQLAQWMHTQKYRNDAEIAAQKEI